MKKLYNLFFSLNNFNEDENYLLDFDEKDDKESEDYKFLNKIFERTMVSPRKKVIDNLINLIHTGKI